MPLVDPLTLDEAALWLVRTRDPAFRDWEEFTAWLEADPSRNDAYEILLDVDDMAVALREAELPLPVVLPDAPSRRHWGRWGAGIAAALIATAGAVSLVPAHNRYSVATRPGEQLELTLADGTAITLNGDTKLTLDRSKPRRVRLDHGEARFAVVHDAADPFMVESGTSLLRDMGTVFNVVRTSEATEVAVAEGEVVFDPDGAAVRLTVGRILYDRDRGLTEVSNTNPATVGLWRSGRLSYNNAPVARVAADISRLIGKPVRVAPTLAERRFSGTIVARGVEQKQLFERVGALVSARSTYDGHAWNLIPEADAAR